MSGSESELGLALTVAIEVFEKHDEPSSLHLPGTVDDYLQGREVSFLFLSFFFFFSRLL